MNDPGAFRFEKGREQPNAMTICAGNLVCGKRLRFRTHYRRSNVSSDLNNPVDAAGEVGGLGDYFSAGFGNVLVSDTVFVQQLGQNHPVELRPARPRHAPDITEKLDAVLLQQLEKVGEWMPAVADGVNSEGCLGHIPIISG